MPKRVLGAICALMLLVAGCSSSNGSDASSPPRVTTPTDPVTTSPSVPVASPTTVARPTAKKAPSKPRPKSSTKKLPPKPHRAAHPTGVPDVAPGAPFLCTSALEDLQAAGADNLEPDAAPVTKALTQCRDVAQWVGGLYAVPAALGYGSASELNDDTIVNDLLTLCAANAGTPTCKNAQARGLFR